MAHILAVNSLSLLGDLEDLSRRLPAWYKEAAERRDLFATISLRTTMGGNSLLALAADEPERARREVADAMAQWSQEEFHFQHFDALMSTSFVDFYKEEGGAAWERVTGAWPALDRAMLLQMQFARIQALALRGAAALAAAQGAKNPKPLVREAERDAKKLNAEKLAWPSALSRLILAGAAAVRGDVGGARSHLKAAISGFDALEMALYAAAARRQLGRILGGEEGRDLVEEADSVMARRGIKYPHRMASVFAPGFNHRL
jgi:hypothetical protein